MYLHMYICTVQYLCIEYMYDTEITWTTVWLSADNHCDRPTYMPCGVRIAYVPVRMCVHTYVSLVPTYVPTELHSPV